MRCVIMPCYYPMVAAPMPGKTKNGKSPIRFLGKASSWSGPAPVNGYLLPDRQCIGCRLERSRQWAIRLLHEVKFHPQACFLTLTYSDDCVPLDWSLNPSHITSFFRDLRARCDYYGKGKLRYLAVGEYADENKKEGSFGFGKERPHYHVALFGNWGTLGEDDGRVETAPSRSGGRQFTHVDFSAVWRYGLHRFSELSFESAAYIARYCLKKIAGVASADHYRGRIPEFQRPSKGFGKWHFERWRSDIYPGDSVELPGRGSFLPPPYYDRLLEKSDPRLYEVVKAKRQEAHKKMTSSEWFAGVERQLREDAVKLLVTKTFLKREGVL